MELALLGELLNDKVAAVILRWLGEKRGDVGEGATKPPRPSIMRELMTSSLHKHFLKQDVCISSRFWFWFCPRTGAANRINGLFPLFFFLVLERMQITHKQKFTQQKTLFRCTNAPLKVKEKQICNNQLKP